MATMKPFMMAAAALALLAMVLICSAPPAVAEGQELEHREAEKTDTSGEDLKTEPDDKKMELAGADQKTWGRSPPWHKATHHHGHHGHHDGNLERSHHESKEPSHHGKPPRFDSAKKKPYPSPPY